MERMLLRWRAEQVRESTADTMMAAHNKAYSKVVQAQHTKAIHSIIRVMSQVLEKDMGVALYALTQNHFDHKHSQEKQVLLESFHIASIQRMTAIMARWTAVVTQRLLLE